MSIAIQEGMSFDAKKDWRVTIDITTASANRSGGLTAADERPLTIKPQTGAASFWIDLQAAQLVTAPEGLGMSLLDVPLDDRETSDISEDPSLTELLMWLGVTLSLPIERRPHYMAPSAEDDSKLISRAELTNVLEAGLAPVGAPRQELSADPRSVSIDLGTVDPDTVDVPTLDPGLRFTPKAMSPAITSPSSTIDEKLFKDLSLEDASLPLSEQTPAQPTVDIELKPFDAPAPDAANTVTVDRPTGVVSVLPNEVHTNTSLVATQSSHSPDTLQVDPRTELSEVVRYVRTMVTERETRTTIQLEPAELGRLTLELVDAPAGLRAHVSAEDPSVLRFLERNVQLLETEARLQGVGNMSFTVGADVSGGAGRRDQRQSEAEASFHKNIEWNTTPQAKPRSRRELDTNA